jgi:uncharacterized protein involved in oxidation of intracellular sulfur
MQYLIILNDPPYGTERSYNGLRLANSLTKTEAKFPFPSSYPQEPEN